MPGPARFWAKVDRSGGPDACWPWTAAKNRHGYGKFKVNGKPELAHRIAYELVVGPLPVGLLLRHKQCGNPPCCNPAHLEPGTSEQNAADMVAMGRSTQGEKNARAVLTEQQVREIIGQRRAGLTLKEIARDHGVCITTVWFIVTGRTWTYLSGVTHAA